MKKAVMLVTLVVTMALSAMCFAAGDGSVLTNSSVWSINLWLLSTQPTAAVLLR